MARDDLKHDALLLAAGVLAGYLILTAAGGLYYRDMTPSERIGFMTYDTSRNGSYGRPY